MHVIQLLTSFSKRIAFALQLLPILLGLVAQPPAYAQSGGAAQRGVAVSTVARFDDFLLLGVGVVDRSAIIKPAKGEATMLKVGDTVPGSTAVLAEVQPDKVLLLIAPTAGGAPERIWMFRSDGRKPGRIERFVTRIDPVPIRPHPTVTVISTAQSATAATASSLAPGKK